MLTERDRTNVKVDLARLCGTERVVWNNNMNGEGLLQGKGRLNNTIGLGLNRFISIQT